MAALKIEPGDEVIIRDWKPEPIVGVVTYDSKEHFCWIMPDGKTYHTTRAAANPSKTGRRFEEVRILLKTMNT